MDSNQHIPIDVAHLLPVMNDRLIGLLKELSEEEWQMQSIATLWTVKDIAAHLLDGNIRTLSMLQDNYFGEAPGDKTLLLFLNDLNADWIKAMKRVSPAMLILLHEVTGKRYCDYYTSLDPFGKAGFAVAWAGETDSKNWMHIAREYTEKWLHQQQIRTATGKPGLMTKEFFYPFMNIFMQALPYTFKDVVAIEGATVQVTISGDIGGTWQITKHNDWVLNDEKDVTVVAGVFIDADIAWRLFSKSIRPHQVKENVLIKGDQRLGEQVLAMITVMA